MAAKGTRRPTVGTGRRLITLEIREPGRDKGEAMFTWETDRSGRPKLDGITSTIGTISEAGERFVGATQGLSVKAQGEAIGELVQAIVLCREQDTFSASTARKHS
jgi:hypothetical protein